jgi:predicted PurR-regulated permease PerM
VSPVQDEVHDAPVGAADTQRTDGTGEGEQAADLAERADAAHGSTDPAAAAAPTTPTTPAAPAAPPPGLADTEAPQKRHSPFALGFLAGAGALLAFWLGQQILSIASVILLIVVAMFLAVGLNPVVELLQRRGLGRAWAVLLVVAGVVTAVTLFVVAIVPVITDQVTTISDRAPVWLGDIQGNRTVQDLDERYGLLDRVESTVTGGEFVNRVFGGVLGVGLALLTAVANTFVVVVLMLYFLASLPSIKRFAYRFAPASRRERVGDLGDRILATVGGYVSGAFIVACAAGLSSLVFLFVVGLGEYAVALALVVALLGVIPMIGATLGAVVVTAIGFATDPRIGLACLVFYLVYQQFENYVIYPKVMSRSVDLPGSLIVVAALVGAALLGVIGALLAVPTAAAAQLVVKEVLLPRQDAR